MENKIIPWMSIKQIDWLILAFNYFDLVYFSLLSYVLVSVLGNFDGMAEWFKVPNC